MVRKPLLVEVKHTDHLERHAEKYAPKFAAAHQFAEDKGGWEFAIVDQTQIRIPRLANLKFLREYRNVSPSVADIQQVLVCLERSAGETSSHALLDSLG